MRMRKPTRAATGVIMLTTMLVAAMPSCQSEEDRKNEEKREELRRAIGIIEKAQKEHINAQREYVRINLKHKPKMISEYIKT